MKRKILLVDDDNICHFINRRLLEDTQMIDHIATASNGEEAINYITQSYDQFQVVPDIIFLDINMPVMNGFSFIEALRMLSHIPQETIKIIVLSSSSQESDKETALQLGVTHYLSKPLSAQVIHDLFNREKTVSD